jgi:hypothetical protein
MRAVGWALLVLFLGYIAVKYYRVEVEIAKRSANRAVAPPGVNYYCNMPVSSRAQQVQAFQEFNCCQSVQCGYAPAIGPQENMPFAVRLEV